MLPGRRRPFELLAPFNKLYSICCTRNYRADEPTAQLFGRTWQTGQSPRKSYSAIADSAKAFNSSAIPLTFRQESGLFAIVITLACQKELPDFGQITLRSQSFPCDPRCLSSSSSPARSGVSRLLMTHSAAENGERSLLFRLGSAYHLSH